MPLELTLCTSKPDWDRLVARSSQGSVFCRTGFLDSLSVEYDLWVVRENGHPQVGAIILRRGQEPVRAPYPFTMYQGVLFVGDDVSAALHRRAKWVLAATEFLLAELAGRYARLSFCLHHSSWDLRGLQWFHYHQPELGTFCLNLFYTGLIDLATFQDVDSYLGSIRTTRRYEYRKALKEGMTVEVSTEVAVLDELHRRTFERQGLERSEEAGRLLRTITHAALGCGFGELLVCRDKRGEAASATLFLYDERTGYYLFGANDPSHRHSNSGTLLMVENLHRCRVRGLRWVDVCGINSPGRGDFKTSFNANPTPYFVATWNRPSRNSVDAA